MSRMQVLRWAVFSLSLICILSVPAFGQGNRNRNNSNRNRQPTIRLPKSSMIKTSVDMEVAPLPVGSRMQAESAASRIDQAVLNHLASRQQRPTGRTSESTYVRRIYLDLAGRIPTAEEARAFIDSKDPDKRKAIVDELLVSPDYVSNFYNMWADVLRLSERPSPNIIADPYLAYVKDAIRTNKPYDRLVYEMLTANGKLWENPAVGYQLRDDGMPLPYVDNTVRIFLGTQIGCAQCHDHPFDDWSQRQFYELAAYTSGTLTRVTRKELGGKRNPAQQLIAEARRTLPQKQIGPLQRLVRANSYSVSESARKLKLPHDYAYDNGKPNQVVQEQVLWGKIPDAASSLSRREQFAAWVTSPDNPKFSRMIGNRLWHRMTGVGVVEPIDDFNDSNAPFSAELLEVLSDEVVRMDFDLRQLIRAIVYSESYQRDAVEVDRSEWDTFVYRGPALRRMTAEQVWDSILTLTVYNPWPFQRPTVDDLKPVADLDLANVDLNAVQRKSEVFGKQYFYNVYKRSLNKQHGYKGLLLCKASELPTPLPAGHFLRQFGQSDRESIDGSNTAATVPQILTMFNGPITHSMLEPGSHMYDQVVASKTPREAIDQIFYSLLSRPPTAEDRRIAVSEMGAASTRPIAYGNIIWALLNTREFLFVR